MVACFLLIGLLISLPLFFLSVDQLIVLLLLLLLVFHVDLVGVFPQLQQLIGVIDFESIRRICPFLILFRESVFSLILLFFLCLFSGLHGGLLLLLFLMEDLLSRLLEFFFILMDLIFFFFIINLLREFAVQPVLRVEWLAEGDVEARVRPGISALVRSHKMLCCYLWVLACTDIMRIG